MLREMHIEPTALDNGFVPVDIDVPPFDNSKSCVPFHFETRFTDSGSSVVLDLGKEGKNYDVSVYDVK